MPTLQFKGKTFVQNHHLAAPYHQLVARPDLSITDRHSLHDNLVVRGDNLLALKALLPTYAGRVKCIYIDPPYNTGNEAWVYNDNVNAPMIQQWLGKIVDKEDLTRHDKWLCMMMPRLKLLWELLAENGAIFISCDDNEQANLRGLLDEIFGDLNWLGTIIWRNVTDNNPTNIAIEHEYVICYAKNKSQIEGVWKSKLSDAKDILIEIGQKLVSEHEDLKELQAAYKSWFKENKLFLGQLDRYKYIDKGGVYTGSQSVHNPGREGYRYDVFHPITGKPCKQPLLGYRFPQETMNDLLSAHKILFGKDENKIIELKLYAHEYEDKLPSVIELDGRVAAYEMNDIFPENSRIFNNPKPSQLIKQLLSYVTKNGDVILDSFAGSATTAQAVLELNLEDGGDRKFVLVEMESYAEWLTAERIRRVINGISEAKNFDLQKGLGGTFSYFELGEKIEYELIMDSAHRMPDFTELARYLFFHATGEQLDANGVRPDDFFVGESRQRVVYLKYRPDVDWLRKNGLTVSDLSDLPTPPEGKRRLVFAPLKYVDDETLREHRVDFHQLPYQIYRMAESK